MEKIIIRDKSYPMEFGMGAIKAFMKLKGLKKISELSAIFDKMQDANDMDIDTMDNMVLIILCSIQFACKIERIDCDLIPEDIESDIFSNPEKQEKVFLMLTESFDTGNEVGTVEADKSKKEAIQQSETLNASQSEN